MWYSQIKEWEEVSDKVYEFVMNESEKKIKDVIDESEKITNRAYNLINILIILIGVVVPYIVKGLVDSSSNQLLLIVSIGLLIPILICFDKCYKLVSKRSIYRNGTNPDEILIPQYIEKQEYNDNDKYKRLILFAIEQNQEKITITEANNLDRINKYQNVLQILFYSFIISLVIIIAILSFNCC